MNQSDMILEFIDGTLGSGEEQNLFDDMAQHPELRAELRQYVMIGDAVRADREAYAPPADVERRLLGGLGIFPFAEAGGAAAAGTAAATVGTASSGTSAFGWLAFASLKAALLPLVVGVLIGVIVGGGGVYLTIKNSSDQGTVVAASDRGDASANVQKGKEQSGSAASTSNSSNATASASTASGIGGVSSTAGVSSGQPIKNGVGGTGAMNAPKASGKNRVISLAHDANGDSERPNAKSDHVPPATSARPSSIAPIDNRTATDLKENPPAVNRTELTSMSPEEQAMIDRDRLLSEDPKVHRSSAVLPLPLPTSAGSSEKKNLFAVEIRKGFISKPFADNQAREMPADFIGEDIIAGAYYSPDVAWYLGLEGGRERFAQSLFYNREDTLFVEQRPVIAWGGVAFGRKMEVFDLPLFLQGTLGASQYGGPMARGRIGFDVIDLFGRNASSVFSLPISLEASSLVYTYNGQYLVTGNWGLSGGVRVRFGF